MNFTPLSSIQLRSLVIFRNIRSADAEGSTDPGIPVSLHHRIDLGKVGHLIDGGHAEAEALQAAQKHTVVPLLLIQ